MPTYIAIMSTYIAPILRLKHVHFTLQSKYFSVLNSCKLLALHICLVKIFLLTSNSLEKLGHLMPLTRQKDSRVAASLAKQICTATNPTVAAFWPSKSVQRPIQQLQQFTASLTK